ncbi:hypothetical protein D6833_13185, partial [Candidatus Parcubacteria bacterium]
MDWINRQAGEFIGGKYVGMLAEEVATHVYYTRYAETIKKMLRFYKGEDTFAEHIMRNPETSRELVNLYKLRILVEDRAAVAKLSSKDLADELVKSAANAKENLLKALGRDAEALRARMGALERERNSTEDPNYRALIDSEISENRNEIEEMEEVMGRVQQLDLGTVGGVAEAIELCRGLAGEYLVQEGLLEFITKINHSEEEVRDRIDLSKNEANVLMKRVREIGAEAMRAIESLQCDRESVHYRDAVSAVRRIRHLSLDDVRRAGRSAIENAMADAMVCIEQTGAPNARSVAEKVAEMQERAVKVAERVDGLVPKMNELELERMFYRRVRRRVLSPSWSFTVGGLLRRTVGFIKERWASRTAASGAGDTPKKFNLVEEVYRYSKRVREKRKEATPYERLMDMRLRNIAFVTDKFLDAVYTPIAYERLATRPARSHSELPSHLRNLLVHPS